MKLTRLVSPAIAIVLIAGTASAFAQYGPPQQGPPPGYQQGPPQGPGGWDAPPPEFREYQGRGYHDGIEGAKRDFENHRAPNPNNRDEYRHPGFIPGPFRHDYKDGFRKGYFAAVRHMEGGPGPYQGGPR